MDFSLSDEQRTLRDATLDFAKKELQDDLIARDRDGVFPEDLWKKCATFGIQGMPFPQAYGGGDSDILTTVLAMEALGYGCKDNGLLFALNAQMWSVQMPIHMFGTDEQKKKYLTPMCKGDLIGAHGMSEPGSGSDAFSLTTTARKEGNSYILNGAKTFVSNAPVADMFVVFANTNRSKGFMGISAFLIDRNTEGLQVGKNIGKMGLRTSPWSEVVMEDCRIDEGQRLGKEGNGAGIFEDSMAWERSFILANYVGGMERQIETCITYAKTRRQFGQPISKFQAVANRIVDMKVRLETARNLLYKVAWMMDKGSPSVLDAAILKLYLSENWIKSCMDATQIHGGYGFTTEYEVERDLRDAVGSTLYSGTSEMQRNLIARHLRL
ncbi:MAG: acyl-CoA dehydrogenase family protein [Ignavibacteria bacterium]|nr:acyl-CoA dehydrogenase family protein [Ignavibacteria bacterium]